MSPDLTKELRRFRTLGSTGTYWEARESENAGPKYKAQGPRSAAELAGIEGRVHIHVRVWFDTPAEAPVQVFALRVRETSQDRAS
jgi:hypothetical protein